MRVLLVGAGGGSMPSPGSWRSRPGRTSLLGAGQRRRCGERRGRAPKGRRRGGAGGLRQGPRRGAHRRGARSAPRPRAERCGGEAGIPCSGPSAAAARLEGSKAFTKLSATAMASPRRSYCRPSPMPGPPRPTCARATRPLPPRPQGRRTRGGEGRPHLPDPGRGARRRGPHPVEARVRRGRGHACSWRSSSGARRPHSWSSATGSGPCPCPRRGTTSAPWTGTAGPNTGGMGAYCPGDPHDRRARGRGHGDVILPDAARHGGGGRPYRGVLYAGLMLTQEGPQLLEFNCRFGDPETQVVLPRLESDLVEICLACAGGRLDPGSVRWKSDAAVTVVLASGGYPGSYATGKAIAGIGEAGEAPGRDGLPRGHPAGGRRAPHGRRAGPERDRPRARPGGGPAESLRRRGRGSVSKGCTSGETSRGR